MKEFTSGAEKLLYEKSLYEDFDLVFDGLVELCKNDTEFDMQVLDESKNFKNCYDFIVKRAKRNAEENASAYAVMSNTLFDWIKEYYAGAIENITVFPASKTMETKSIQPVAKAETVITVEAKSKKKKSKDAEGQISLFDMAF